MPTPEYIINDSKTFGDLKKLSTEQIQHNISNTKDIPIGLKLAYETILKERGSISN